MPKNKGQFSVIPSAKKGGRIRYDYLKNDLLLEAGQEVLEMLGIENKRRRTMMSRTLSDYDCEVSISYLSKIENGKIIPKYHVLKDFCAKNGISDEELNSMLIVNKNLRTAVDYFIKKNIKGIENLFINVRGFNNYKTNLLKLFYYYFEDDYEEICYLLNEISPIENKMNEFDHNIFLFFKMTYENHEKKYFDSLYVYLRSNKCDDDSLNFLLKKEYVKAILLSGASSGIDLYKDFIRSDYVFLNINDNDLKEAYDYALARQGLCSQKRVSDLSVINQIFYHYYAQESQELYDINQQELNDLERYYLFVFLKRKASAKELLTTLEDRVNSFDVIRDDVIINEDEMDDLEFYNFLVLKVGPLINQINDAIFLDNLIMKFIVYGMKVHKYRETINYIFLLIRRKEFYQNALKLGSTK